MKIGAFLGSPREKGNTAALLDPVREALMADHHDVETTHVARLRISPCEECFACQKVQDQTGCSQDDDMQDLHRRILDLDVIILACPVFCWSFPAQMKSFLDRLYCMAKFSSDGTHASLLENKKCALVVTAGGDEFDGADLVVAAYQRMVDFLRMKNLGHLVVADFRDREILEASYIRRRIDRFCVKFQ